MFRALQEIPSIKESGVQEHWRELVEPLCGNKPAESNQTEQE